MARSSPLLTIALCPALPLQTESAAVGSTVSMRLALQAESEKVSILVADVDDAIGHGCPTPELGADISVLVLEECVASRRGQGHERRTLTEEYDTRYGSDRPQNGATGQATSPDRCSCPRIQRIYAASAV